MSSVYGCLFDSDDPHLAKILCEGSKGWRTLSVNPGPMSAAVILERCSIL